MNVTPRCAVSSLIARIATRALYFEVKAYPKPGLVSFIDSGGHQDMNGATFYRSIFTLRHYFYQIAKEGLIQNSFEALRQKGIEAEQRMMKRTQGINTHRGAIFALGLLSVSAARITTIKGRYTPMELHQQLLSDWQKYLAEHHGDPSSHGAVVRRTFPVVDAKQMASQGYELIFHLLPSFTALFLETGSLDSACLFAYLELLVRVDDTNVLYRKGKPSLDFAKEKAADLLAIHCLQTRREKALNTHQLFSKEGISPGGVADLLGVLLFVGQLFCEPLRCHY